MSSESYKYLEDYHIYLHDANGITMLSDLDLQDETITCIRSDVPLELAPFFSKSAKGRRLTQENRRVLSEVHFYLIPGLAAMDDDSNGYLEIPTSSVVEVVVMDNAPGRAVLNVVGVAVGVLIVVGLIAAATKSSCPYVYVFDGEEYTFQGEIYSGANASNLERGDVIYLSGLEPDDDVYSVRISNELRERQFINKTKLAVIDHPPGTMVFTDQNGQYHLVEQYELPSSVIDAEGNDITLFVSESDSLYYSFDAPTNTENGILATFDNPDKRDTVNLILNLKNSIWGDYIIGEFQSLFGNKYNWWRKRQEKLTYEERRSQIDSSGMLLKMEVFENGEWNFVDNVYFVGPMGLRDILIPLKTNRASEVKIKLSTAYRFWDLNSIRLSFDHSENNGLNISYPEMAGASGNVSRTLSMVDNKYYKQPEVGDNVDLFWRVPDLDATSTRSVFLECTGYYEPVRDFKGKPDIVELDKFQSRKYFSEFSRMKYEKVQGLNVRYVHAGFDDD